MATEIVSQGSGISGIIVFKTTLKLTADSSGPVSRYPDGGWREMAKKEQIRLGYHPNGYGGPDDINVIENQDGDIELKWSCYASCD